VKSANLEQHRAAMKEMLAAWQRKRAAWLAMATLVLASDEERAAPTPPATPDL
jgi:hypothetical protein